MAAGFFHREYFNQTVTKNALVDPVTDYTAYTVAVPANAKLPNGGGQQVTVYNLNANKLGVVDSVSTFSTLNTRVYNGLEFSLNARLPRNGFVFGSVTTERTAVNTCDVANSDPNNLRFCDQVPPFKSLFKVSGGYRIPFDVQLSGTLQFRPGGSIASTYVFNSAAAGFAITGGGNLTITNVVDPTTQYYDYIRELDVRASRTFRFGRQRLQGFVEIFNIPNFSTIFQVNTRIGPLYMNPQLIDQPRHLQLGLQYDW